MKTERWLPVVGYEALYQVSDHGNIRRIGNYSDGRRIPFGRPIKQNRHPVGYFQVTLSDTGIHRRHLVHRLVAHAFLGPCPEGKEVNHKDGCKTHNAIENIEYLTHSENHFHRYRILGQKSIPTIRGSQKANAKLTESSVKIARTRYAEGDISYMTLASSLGVCKKTLMNALKGKTWNHVT